MNPITLPVTGFHSDQDVVVVRRTFEKKGCACFMVSASILATGKRRGDACLIGRLVASRDGFSVFL